MTKTPTEPTVIELADVKWATFMAQLQAAEEQFVRRQPAAFKALWSNAEDISICGAFGGVVKGRDEVGQRLDWASAHFSEGTRSRKEISVVRGSNLAHVVQTEWIHIAQRTSPNSLRFRCAYPWPFDWRRTAGAFCTDTRIQSWTLPRPPARVPWRRNSRNVGRSIQRCPRSRSPA